MNEDTPCWKRRRLGDGGRVQTTHLLNQPPPLPLESISSPTTTTT
uniref:Uncharacterized protein n=1 Tax=Cyanidioschyzon merolae (strain NIES-3377 / 10D) TaxID=280699 RepID=Q85G37_CYAM1|nr:ORF44 [Cyanidioschyzon merolae strain 10D]BAC76154.1 unnamed protein product [Cyanidioschyzon merolae strain 10D]